MTMLLQGQDGSEFELALIEDRLPEIQDGHGDGTALTLSFRVATPEESWEETSPCLNTFEVRNLAEWLDAVGQGPAEQPDEPELDLLEPELNFQLIDDSGDEVVLRVAFNLEDRPEVYEVDAPTEELPHVDLRVTREHVRRAAAQLRDDLQGLGRSHEESASEGAPTTGGGEDREGPEMRQPGAAAGVGGTERMDADDLLGEMDMAEARPPMEELGVDFSEVPDERVGFGEEEEEQEREK